MLPIVFLTSCYWVPGLEWLGLPSPVRTTSEGAIYAPLCINRPKSNNAPPLVSATKRGNRKPAWSVQDALPLLAGYQSIPRCRVVVKGSRSEYTLVCHTWHFEFGNCGAQCPDFPNATFRHAGAVIAMKATIPRGEYLEQKQMVCGTSTCEAGIGRSRDGRSGRRGHLEGSIHPASIHLTAQAPR